MTNKPCDYPRMLPPQSPAERRDELLRVSTAIYTALIIKGWYASSESDSVIYAKALISEVNKNV